MSIESGEGKGCCIRLITPLILEPRRGTHPSHISPAKETRP